MDDIVWQPARVLESGEDWIRVGFDRLSACQACLRGEGCGAGVYSRLFVTRQATLRINSINPLPVGQTIRVGVSPNNLLLASFLLYAAPLVAFLLGALVAHLALAGGPWQDPIALMAGLGGAAAVLLALRHGRGLKLNPRVEALPCSAT